MGFWSRLLDVFRAPPEQLTGATILNATAAGHNRSFNDFSEAYQRCPWVFAAVRVLMDSISQARFVVREFETGEIAERHPLQLLLDRPNEWMSGLDFRRTLIAHRAMYGQDDVLKDAYNGQGLPRELWVLEPPKVKVIPGTVDPVIGYRYTVNGMDTTYPADQVLHLTNFNPASPYYGQSDFEAVRDGLNNELRIEEWVTAILENDGQPGGVLKTNEPSVGKGQRELMESALKAKLRKGNRGNPIILWAGYDWTSNAFSPREMEFTEYDLRIMRQTLASAGVPPSMVGYTDGVNYATAQAQVEQFWRNTMLPRAREILTMFEPLLTEFRSVTGGRRYSLDLDTSKVEALQADRAQMAATFQTLMLSMSMTGTSDPYLALKWAGMENEADEWADAHPTVIDVVPIEEDQDDPFGRLVRSAETLLLVSREDEAQATADATFIEWDAWDRAVRKPMEETFASAMRAYFRKLGPRLAKKYKLAVGRGGLVQIENPDQLERNYVPRRAGWEDAFEFDAELAILIRALEPMVREAFLAGVGKASSQLGVGISLTMPPPLVEANVHLISIYVLNEHSNQAATIFAHALEEGWSNDEIANALLERFGEPLNFGRAHRIARTETTRHVNLGQVESYKAKGIQQKRWIAQGHLSNEGSRDSHAALDNKVVGVNEPFILPNGVPNAGAQAQQPGGFGIAAQDINCKCTVAPVVPDDWNPDEES
jgi:HK97 family phage portal protein